MPTMWLLGWETDQGPYTCVCALPDDLCVFPVLALAVPPLAVHDGGVHVGGGEGVGLIQQGDDAQQDGPWGEERGSQGSPACGLQSQEHNSK